MRRLPYSSGSDQFTAGFHAQNLCFPLRLSVSRLRSVPSSSSRRTRTCKQTRPQPVLMTLFATSRWQPVCVRVCLSVIFTTRDQKCSESGELSGQEASSASEASWSSNFHALAFLIRQPKPVSNICLVRHCGVRLSPHDLDIDKRTFKSARHASGPVDNLNNRRELSL